MSSINSVAFVMLAMSLPAAIGWNAYQLGRSRAEIDRLTLELTETKSQVAELRQDDKSAKLLIELIRAADAGTSLKAKWSNLNYAK